MEEGVQVVGGSVPCCCWSFDCVGLGCDCDDVDADDVLFFQVETVVYIDRPARRVGRHSRETTPRTC